MQVQNILKSIYNELYSYIIEFICKFVCMSSDRAMFLRILGEIKIVPMSTPAYPPTPMIGKLIVVVWAQAISTNCAAHFCR